GCDEASQAPEGVFLKSVPHPRAYGNFARLLGKYVREEKLLPLEEAIRKLTSLPATNLGLDHRGLLREGYFADLVVFDPQTIAGGSSAQTLEVQLTREAPKALAADARQNGNAHRGAVLFHQPHVGCTKCHVVDGGPNLVAPDLTKLGRDVTDEFLIESVLLPS